MSAFSASNFDADAYAKHRPKYTKAIYDRVKNYHQAGSNLLVDVGCGPGTATFQMVEQFSEFKHFRGTDVSPLMIEAAKKEQKKFNVPAEKLEFVNVSSDKFDFLGEQDSDKGKVDLITAVECAHWFDFEKFQKSAYKNLSNNGTLAIWGYCRPSTPDYPKIATIRYKYRVDDDKLGPYWEQPGTNIIQNYYKPMIFDNTLFKDVHESVYYSQNFGQNAEDDKMMLQLEMPLKQFRDHIRTASAYQSWRKEHPTEKDMADIYMEEVLKEYPELTEDTIIKVVISTFFKFARKRTQNQEKLFHDKLI